MAPAATSRSARTTRLERNGLTISAARWPCSACSFPAGECISSTVPKPKATSFVRSTKSAIDPEQLLDGEAERFGELQRKHSRRGEHAVLHRVHRLSRDPDPLGGLGLGDSELGTPVSPPVGKPLSHL